MSVDKEKIVKAYDYYDEIWKKFDGIIMNNFSYIPEDHAVKINKKLLELKNMSMDLQDEFYKKHKDILDKSFEEGA